MSLLTEKIFLSICSLGSFAAAAKQQHLSQPAISMAISNLEESLGVKLFFRSPGHKSITLTNAGLLYRDYANTVVQKYEEMLIKLGGDIGQCTITVLTSPAPAATIFPPLYNAFHASFPSINIHNIICNGPDVFASLKRNEACVALSGISQNYDEFITERFFYDPLVFVCPKNMKINETISLREFRKLPLIVRRNNFKSTIISSVLEKHGIKIDDLNIVMQVSSNPDIYQAIAFGSGTGFVTRSLLSSYLDSEKKVKIVNIASLVFSRHIHLVRSKGIELSPSLNLFWNFALSSSWREQIYDYPTHPRF